MCLKRCSRIFLEIHFEGRDQDLVREKGLAPPRIAAQDPKSCVSTNSTTLALSFLTTRQEISVKDRSIFIPTGALKIKDSGRLTK